jgi:hypothetical protein
VQSFDDVFTVNSADLSQVTEVTHLFVRNYAIDEVSISIIVSEENLFCFIQNAIWDKKTLIFDVLDWPGNSLAAKYNSTNLSDYNVNYQKPISSYLCLHNPLV